MVRPESAGTAVVIPAAGSGTRLGGPRKQFRLLGGKPLLIQTALRFQQHSGVNAIVIAAPPNEVSSVKAHCKEYGLTKVTAVVAGGETRQASVRLGVDAVDDSTEFILTHDAVRPFVSTGDIDDLLQALGDNHAAVLAAPVYDTLCRGRDNRVSERLERDRVFRLLTPQGFRDDVLRRAHAAAHAEGREYTDEVTLVRAIGVEVALIESTSPNMKITTPADWELAGWLWGAWEAQNANR